MEFRAPALLSIVLTVAAGCGASRQAGWERDQTRSEGNVAQVLADAEAAWHGREDVARLRDAIGLYEKAIEVNPNQPEILTRLARANYFLADAYLRDNREEQLRVYDIATSWGERAMATHAGFHGRVQAGDAVEDAITSLSADYAGAVYWTASALGKWARLKGFTTLLSKKNAVKKYMDWVTQVDPTYFYHGPDRYWGVYYAVAPSFAGGDLAKSDEHFNKSLDGSPNYLGTKVLMADALMTKRQDRVQFENLLKSVIDADPTVIPDIVAEQKAEQQKARELLAKSDDLFAATEAHPATLTALTLR